MKFRLKRGESFIGSESFQSLYKLLTEMKNKKRGRTIKTLLLCKLNSRTGDSENLFEVFKAVYNGNCEDPSKLNCGMIFATIGKVDAISLYNTLRAEQGTKCDNWLEYAYQDRNTIIHRSNATVTYHPIHLIANEYYTSNREAKPCAVITLIYGVNSGNAENHEDAEEGPAFRSYEQVIRSHLYDRFLNYNEKIRNPESVFPKEFEVYNAINICDVVVINYTEDLKRSLKIINDLSEYGIARKTLTLLCLPMNNSDSMQKQFNSSEPISIVDKFVKGSEDGDSLSLRIEGSIRNQVYFESFKKALLSRVLPNEEERIIKFSDRIIFGQSDFSLQLNDLKREELNELFKFIFLEHKAITNACWDAHTEFLYNPTLTPLKRNGIEISSDTVANDPKKILENLYKKFSLFSNYMLEQYQELDNLPWYNAFYELLGVHTNIDADPILHGPGYLIYRFATILYDYVDKYILETKGEVGDTKKKSDPSAKTKYATILKESSEDIGKAIQDWGNLTDQILRIDDLIFHGFGNSSSLYNTMPECALDFYHAMILRVVEFIYKHDIYYQLVNRQIEESEFRKAEKEYCYDFLLLPSTGDAINIHQMFYTDKMDAFLPNPFGLSNSEKQVYLARFPIAAVYSPFTFFTSLVHECFHKFGDICRLRNIRSRYICRFTTELLLSQFFSELKGNVRSTVKGIILNNLEIVFENEDEPNGAKTRELLSSGIDTVLSKDILFRLRTIAKHSPSLYEDYCAGFAFDDDKLKYCIYHFQEGYADLMMILFLRLSPAQYYKIFFNQQGVDAPESMILDGQRIALISALLCSRRKKWTSDALKEAALYQKTGLDLWTSHNVKKYLDYYFSDVLDVPGTDSVEEYHLSDYIISYFDTLRKNRDNLEIPAAVEELIFKENTPPPCMREVMAYLNEVEDKFIEAYEIENLQSDNPEEEEDTARKQGQEPECDYTQKTWLEDWIKLAPSLDDLRNDFDEFFVQDRMFNSHFFEIIAEDHNKVVKMVEASTE